MKIPRLDPSVPLAIIIVGVLLLGGVAVWRGVSNSAIRSTVRAEIAELRADSLSVEVERLESVASAASEHADSMSAAFERERAERAAEVARIEADRAAFAERVKQESAQVDLLVRSDPVARAAIERERAARDSVVASLGAVILQERELRRRAEMALAGERSARLAAEGALDAMRLNRDLWRSASEDWERAAKRRSFLQKAGPWLGAGAVVAGGAVFILTR